MQVESMSFSGNKHNSTTLNFWTRSANFKCWNTDVHKGCHKMCRQVSTFHVPNYTKLQSGVCKAEGPAIFQWVWHWSSSCGGSNFLVSELKAISIWFVGSIVFKMDLKSLKFASNYVPADFQVGIWGGAVSCHQQPFFHLWRGLWRHISETDAHATLAACRYTAWRCCVDKSQRLQEFKEPSWINADVLWAMTDVPEHESTITCYISEVRSG